MLAPTPSNPLEADAMEPLATPALQQKAQKADKPIDEGESSNKKESSATKASKPKKSKSLKPKPLPITSSHTITRNNAHLHKLACTDRARCFLNPEHTAAHENSPPMRDAGNLDRFFRPHRLRQQALLVGIIIAGTIAVLIVALSICMCLKRIKDRNCPTVSQDRNKQDIELDDVKQLDRELQRQEEEMLQRLQQEGYSAEEIAELRKQKPVMWKSEHIKNQVKPPKPPLGS